jgi:2'-5' RNA ligase
MRLFIAIDLPEDVKSELKKAQDSLRSEKDKLTIARELHLTLKFLGETPEKEVEKIKKALSKIKFKRFKLRLDGTGLFPTEKFIRVAWVGLEESKDLKELAQKIKESLPEYKEDYPFNPHLTLSRIKLLENRENFVKKVKNLKIKPLEFEVKNFVLYSSKLSPKGPTYNTLDVLKSH